MLNDHGIVTSYLFIKQEHADLALFDESLQIPIDRPEADTRQCPAHPLIDLISVGMGMIALQSLVYGGQLPGHAFAHFTNHNYASRSSDFSSHFCCQGAPHFKGEYSLGL